MRFIFSFLLLLLSFTGFTQITLPAFQGVYVKLPPNGLSAATAGTSAKQIKTDYPASTTGIYWIKNNNINGGTPFQVYADMSTDNGGWMLVLNYLHMGGTNPNLAFLTSSLPLQGSTTLGVDESGSATYWGHATPALLSKFTFTELRFYGRTSLHTRIIHFKTAHANTLNYFRTGSGSMTGIGSSFTSLTGHTANLPASTQNYFFDQGNLAMTNFPFWLSSTYHWGIRGHDSRWEVDDFPGNSSYHTHHQIWIR